MPIFDAHAYLADTPFFHGMADRDAMLNTLRRHEIDGVALISGLAAHCDFVTGNQRLQGVLDPAQGLFGYLTLNADYSEESLDQQRRYLGRREFIAGVMFGHDGNPVTLDNARDVLNAHRRYAKPMAVHVPNAEAVNAARRMASEFPTMKFLFLTMGGEDWHSAVAAARQHLNIYLGISGSLDADKVTHAAATLTARKLLYGSGLPESDPELTLGLVETASALTQADRRRILFENAVQLFNTERNAAESDTEE